MFDKLQTANGVASLEFMVRDVDEVMQSLFLYMDPDPIVKQDANIKQVN